MSITVNIARRVQLTEPGYRYKREQIVVSHEHFKGNVTRIVNTNTLAKQLQLQREDLDRGLEKCIKRKLGISTCGPLTFPGTLQVADLDDVLQGLIEQYVLCPVCHLPEWNRVTCNACGHQKGASRANNAVAVLQTQTFEIETDYGAIPEWEKRLSDQMHRLYDIRDSGGSEMDPDELDRINLLLSACWVADTPALAKKVTKVFNAHYA